MSGMNNQRPQPTEATFAEQRWTSEEAQQILRILSTQEIKEMIINMNSQIDALTEQVQLLQSKYDFWKNQGEWLILDQSAQDLNRIFQAEISSPSSSKDQVAIILVKDKREDDSYASTSNKNLLMLAAIALKEDAKMVPRRRQEMNQHIICGFCGKVQRNISTLRKHERFHLSVRPFGCKHGRCNKKYKTRAELIRHMVAHSGDKKYLCEMCGKRFLRNQNFKIHMLSHRYPLTEPMV